MILILHWESNSDSLTLAFPPPVVKLLESAWYEIRIFQHDVVLFIYFILFFLASIITCGISVP